LVKELQESNVKLREDQEKLEQESIGNNKLVKELQEKVECPVCLVVPREGPVQGRDASADLRKSAEERFAYADGKTSAADRFICGFGQNQEETQKI